MSEVMTRWGAFTREELYALRDCLEAHCDVFEDTCEVEADLLDDIVEDLLRRDVLEGRL